MAQKTIWEEQGILVMFSGTVTDDEIMLINDLMYGDKRFGSITYQIFDYTNATEILINERKAKVIGTLDRTSSRWTSQKMLNIVVTQDEKFIPIVEAYFKEFEGTHWDCRLFSTLDQAYDWIKLQ